MGFLRAMFPFAAVVRSDLTTRKNFLSTTITEYLRKSAGTNSSGLFSPSNAKMKGSIAPANSPERNTCSDTCRFLRAAIKGRFCAEHTVSSPEIASPVTKHSKDIVGRVPSTKQFPVRNIFRAI